MIRNSYLRSTNMLTRIARKERLTMMLRRGYRGDSGEMIPNVSAAEEALQEKARAQYQTIIEAHHALPKTSEDRKKRLIYRSKQRGWLEVDLLLGTWANENVSSLSEEELDSFEEFVNEETIDIYNILTLRSDIPERLSTNDVVSRIQQWAKTSPLGKADQSTYRDVKTRNNLI
mmetsp:Transcript_2064/g.2759  ORF Transcript_2064/g.2759 Transcript_2064/m.2759 type:complete len:174 (-) Transcript_2064:226-747(-)